MKVFVTGYGENGHQFGSVRLTLDGATAATGNVAVSGRQEKSLAISGTTRKVNSASIDNDVVMHIHSIDQEEVRRLVKLLVAALDVPEGLTVPEQVGLLDDQILLLIDLAAEAVKSALVTSADLKAGVDKDWEKFIEGRRLRRQRTLQSLDSAKAWIRGLPDNATPFPDAGMKRT